MHKIVAQIKEFTIPKPLLQIPQRPTKLRIRGTFPVTDHYLAVVGGRRHSHYGEQVVKALIKGLHGTSITIISGLAYGIDSLAHLAAIEAGLPTIAFPGSSLEDEFIYPSKHLRLVHRILQSKSKDGTGSGTGTGGCLISEFESGLRGQPWMFPKRNRLMAGLADAVLIIEAEEKSGTLITARLALEYNRAVCAVPGSIFSPYSKAPNRLIGEGAIPITSSLDILRALNIDIDTLDNSSTAGQNSPKNPKGLETRHFDTSKRLSDLKPHCSPLEFSILNALHTSVSNDQSLTRDVLFTTLEVSIQELNISLSLLEFKDLIKIDAGKIYLTLF